MGDRLQGKISIITGGGSGIGRRAALTFAEEGSSVVVADKNAEAALAVAGAIHDAGGSAAGKGVDVADADAVRSLIESTVDEFGRLDVLVNNAGYGFAGTVVDTTEADWDALMAVNVKGIFLACKYAIPLMERQGGGAIVNTASTTSKVGIRDRAAYCASKGAVASLTRAMALDHVQANIRVNCVAPGTVETPYFTQIFRDSADPEKLRAELEARQAMNRLGQPQEIANAILFLASEESSFCTGSMLVVDGGWTAK